MSKKIKIKDRPDKGRKGVRGLGPYCSLVIDPNPKKDRKGKSYFCVGCGRGIEKGRKVATAILNNWITDDFRFMSGGRFPTTFSLCSSDECSQKIKDNVGDGKKMSIRDWAQHWMRESKREKFTEKGWEYDYLKSAENEGLDPAESLEKALTLVAKDKNIPAAHKKAFFEHHGRDSADIKKITQESRPSRDWKVSDVPEILDTPDLLAAILNGLAKRQAK